MRTPLAMAFALATLLTGCAKEMAYIRYDGQRASTDPVLAQQFQQDAAICNGEMQKANVSGVTFTGGGLAGAVAASERGNAVGQVAQGCMAQKGYAYDPKEQAEARLTEFAAVAEEKRKREAALQAPPPPTITQKKRAPVTTATTTAQAQR
ncbi:MAG: hypothetical protein NTV56_01090 [Alphaproteobacteria bacterium]|nr:hypothetical protein [Alphaproteobacteria bacterium]